MIKTGTLGRTEAVVLRFSSKWVFLKICEISQENTSPYVLQLYLKETPTQMFSCKIAQIFKNTFLIEHFRWLLLKGVCEGTAI